MSWNWAKNMVGVSLDEEEMKKIPNPTFELGVHVTTKSVQAFGILGTVVVGPLSAIRSGPLIKKMTKYGKWGVIIGLVAGPTLTYARLRAINFDEDGIYDRCYRLRHNYNQVRVDRGSFVGAVTGAGLFPMLGACPVLGSLVGMSTGVFVMAAYNMQHSAKSAEKIHSDSKTEKIHSDSKTEKIHSDTKT